MDKPFRRGDQIAYIPSHAEGDLEHPDIQFGFVTSGPTRNDPNDPGSNYFCRYWLKDKPGELRTKANSELTPVIYLVPFQKVSQEVVQKALGEYC